MSDEATQAEGEPKPLDADVRLFRRIRPDQIVDDANSGTRRPSSAGFKDPEMSVDAEVILTNNGLDWNFSLKDYPDYSLVAFPVGAATSLGLDVQSKPIIGVNPAHVEVIGKKTQGIANSLRNASNWVHLKPK